MAIKFYTAASGNWSVAGNWNGGTLPASGDDVYANGKTVTINVDVSVALISTETCPDTGVGGGEFRVSSSRTITAQTRAGDSQAILVNTASVTLTLIGSVAGGSGAAARGIYLNQQGITLNIYGAVSGGTGSGGAYAVVQGSGYSSATVNIFGTVTAGAGSRAIVASTAASINVAGSVAGGALAAIQADLVTVAGEIRAGSGGAGVAEYTQGAGVVALNGSAYNSGAWQAVISGRLSLADSSQVMKYSTPAGEEVLMYNELYYMPPSQADVRAGVVYGSRTGACAVPPPASVALNVPVGNTVGELVASVTTPEQFVEALKADELGQRLAECSTDTDTTLILEAIGAIPTPDPGASPAEFVQALKADDLGERLSNCSTVAITGAQIAGAIPTEA